MRDDVTPIRRDAATQAQVRAADPDRSVWLGANAGSGKTRVLTDRVAWLLLEGTEPDRILCLTYTKAAAGEMQNRLFRRLGEWAMERDDPLRRKLEHLGVPRGRISSEALRRARTLFARAIETPGGLKIQTIHAFCAGLLRRFPLEAGVSPGFGEVGDAAAAAMRQGVLDLMAADPSGEEAVRALAAHASDAAMGDLAVAISKRAEALAEGLGTQALRAAVGADAPPDPVPTEEDLRLCEGCVEALAACGGADSRRLGAAFAALRAAEAAERAALLGGAMLTQGGTPRARLYNAKAKKALDEEVQDALADVAARVLAHHHAALAEANLRRTAALHGFAPVFLRAVGAAKAARGVLDFDDQVRLARRLLCARPDVAQWVLYKLDGGIDHLLVDEAQDTAPAQWDLIEALTAEFGAGEGARGAAARTLFVVGDPKQSIYSFQGADPGAFDAMRRRLGDKLEHGPAPVTDHALRHSFRSSPVILGLVDRVFAGGGGVGAPPEHHAFDPDLPGRVDLWPRFEDAEAPEGEIGDPVDAPAADGAGARLAAAVADRVARMLREGAPVAERTAGGVRLRPMEAGDVLILLRSRKALFHQIVGALKAHPDRLEVAGADRVRLSDEVAVQDLLAVLRFAATPEDDLSLAEVLRSPLGGVCEDGLFRLAHGRKRSLWRALRDSGAHEGVVAMLRDLLRVADFLRPYEMLQRVLVRHDGMARLLARLGEEAREGIELLLGQALAFERAEVPGLTGFLEWLAAADVEVRRESGTGAIRVMTVHGSKGLEAPVVILPDTGPGWNHQGDALGEAGDGTVVWMPRADEAGPALAALREEAKARRDAERDRLLYVALTRAAQWLVVADAGKAKKDAGKGGGKDGEERGSGPSWHERVAAAMEDAVPCADGPEGTLRLEAGDWAPLGPARPAGCEDVPAWGWTAERCPAEPRRGAPVAPSDLGGAKTVPGEHADVLDRDDALAHGTRVHLLLEHLPGEAAGARAAAAEAVLCREGPVDPLDVEDALAEAEAVLDDPALAWAFADGTLAEAPFVLPAAGGRPEVSGTMDRVILRDGAEGAEVWVVDHKTNRRVPDAPDAVPEGILRQMGAYAAALGAIHPDRRVRTAVLWTAEARLMELPGGLVAEAWARA